MKRLVFALLSTCLCIGLLAGCGNNNATIRIKNGVFDATPQEIISHLNVSAVNASQSTNVKPVLIPAFEEWGKEIKVGGGPSFTFEPGDNGNGIKKIKYDWMMWDTGNDLQTSGFYLASLPYLFGATGDEVIKELGIDYNMRFSKEYIMTETAKNGVWYTFNGLQGACSLEISPAK